MSGRGCKPPSPRDILSTPSGARGGPTGVFAWLDSHPEAAEFVREWARMVAEGSCDWSRQRLHSHLREHHGFPFKHDDPISKWLAEKH